MFKNVFRSTKKLMMNNTHPSNFSHQSRYHNQTSTTPQNQHPSRPSNARFNYQPPFNRNTQRPPFSGVPNNNNNPQPPISFPPPHSSFNTAHPTLNSTEVRHQSDNRMFSNQSANQKMLASVRHAQPSTPFPPQHSFNITHQTQNQSVNVSSQHNYVQPPSRMYGESNIKQPPTHVQNMNTTISNSSTHGPTTSCFPPNYPNIPSQAQPITHNTSFQSKELYLQVQPPPPNASFQPQESYSNNSQVQMNLPHHLNIARPPVANFQGTVMPSSFNPNFALPPPPNVPRQLIDKSLTVTHSGPAVPPTSFPLVPQMMPAFFTQTETVLPPAVVKVVSEKESKISSFLEKFTPSEKKKLTNRVTVAQFRETLKQSLLLVKKLRMCKNNLSQLLQSDEKEWSLEVNKVTQYQNQLAQACNFLTTPKYLNCIRKKLQLIKKKRNSVKKLKQNASNERTKKMKEREQLNQEIDKWLDSIKEKNLKLKRETEMKKEADSILSEVRRKIQEAKRTVEKIKVFEKLRNTRQSNAAKKGLILPEHDERFQKSISHLKETVYQQLSHYESEEKALKVMLEAEQEGQLEEEAKWKIKRLRTLQDKRKKNIIESLFGDSIEEPEEDEALYLFHQFQNSANKSVDNLVQIRHQWDMLIHENGEPVPHQWVVPVPPSSTGWEITLNS